MSLLNFSLLCFSACFRTFSQAVLMPSNTCALQWRSCPDDSICSISFLSMSNCRPKDFITLAQSVIVPCSVESIDKKFSWASSLLTTSDNSCRILKLMYTRVVVFSTLTGVKPALKIQPSTFIWWPKYFCPDLEVPSRCKSHASASSRASNTSLTAHALCLKNKEQSVWMGDQNQVQWHEVCVWLQLV